MAEEKEDEKESKISGKRIRIFKQESFTGHIYLSGEIGPPQDYIDEIHFLQTSPPALTIFLHINSVGGRGDTMMALITALNQSQSKIVTCLEPNAWSAGSAIFLQGDEFIVPDNASLMIHNYSSGWNAKGHELTSAVNFEKQYFEQVARSIYYPFMNEKEIQKMLDGADFWMDSADIRKRLDKWMKKLKKKVNKK